MSFVAQLHAYQDMGFYEDPILTEAWYEIDNPAIPEDRASVELLFRNIATAFADEYGDQIDPSILNDFNWGDFVEEIPDEFLARHGVHMLYGDVPQSALVIFTHHDELLLS